ncbi:MAG: hypothetical protein ACRD2X_05875 [Vicinamibacteraceae bacterium]
MRYSKPELVVLGPAPVLVLGGPPGQLDHSDPEAESRPRTGIVLGLDD